MKYWSIIMLTVFLNFTALPGVAAMFGWELPTTNVIMNEEETHSNTFVLYEKTIPKTMNIHDFIKFREAVPQIKSAINWEESSYYSPLLSIFSPPPEA